MLDIAPVNIYRFQSMTYLLDRSCFKDIHLVCDKKVLKIQNLLLIYVPTFKGSILSDCINYYQMS